MTGRRIDLNSDLGESYGAWTLGEDAAMLDVVSSANIACGFHAGDPLTLLTTVVAAVERGVAIGAQVGYHDLVGFGRRFIDVEPAALRADVLYQIGALDGLARSVGGRVSYVKPHGALYNTIGHHEQQAAAVVSAVAAWPGGLPVLGLPGSRFLMVAAEAGLPTVAEAFADRAYLADGTLAPRSRPGAVLHDPAEVADRVRRMVLYHTADDIDGRPVSVTADSVCVHGDSPGAVAMARAVRAALTAAGVTISAFGGHV
ncbi:MAG: 5-oxoprolinase subunit PxpA [Nakamurella sp.]